MSDNKLDKKIETQNVFQPYQPQTEAISLNAPIPTQLPQKVNINFLKDQHLRSNTIDTLIEQNDDLMARLSVSLRRNSQMEEEINQQKLKNEDLKFQFENLKDQVLILREKSSSVQERNLIQEKLHDSIVEELDILKVKSTEETKEFEIRIAQAYQDRDNVKIQLEQELTSLKIRLSDKQQKVLRYQKYGKHLSQIAHALREEKRGNSSEIRSLRLHLLESRKKLSESTVYIQEQAKIHKKEQQSLINNYEKSLNSLNETMKDLREKNLHLKLSFDENIDLKNQIIVSERAQQESDAINRLEIEKLQKSLGQYRSTSKELALSLEKINSSKETLLNENQNLTQSNDKLSEQVESLQILWRDKQAELETSLSRIESLQKLNQNISCTLNKYRSDLRQLKDTKETTVLLNTITEQKMSMTPLSKSQDPQDFHPDLMNKIDQLLLEIQSGFKKNNSEEHLSQPTSILLGEDKSGTSTPESKDLD